MIKSRTILYYFYNYYTYIVKSVSLQMCKGRFCSSYIQNILISRGFHMNMRFACHLGITSILQQSSRNKTTCIHVFAGDSIYMRPSSGGNLNGSRFSTTDNYGGRCANKKYFGGGGWWYNNCFDAHLTATGSYYQWAYNVGRLSASVMMIR